jgi:hypothetical protein
VDPISSVFERAWHEWDDPIEASAIDYCKTAKSVTAVVSDACRTSTNGVDAVLCDDPKMAVAQQTLLGAAKDLVMTIIGVFAGRP